MKFLGLLLFFNYSTIVFASGPISSGGGAGVICPTSQFSGFRATTLDRYESSILEGFKFENESLPINLQIEKAGSHLSFDRALQIELRDRVSSIQSRTRFLPVGVGIQVPGDIGKDFAVPVPTGCTLNAIGFYQKNGILLVSRDTFELMSETDKAVFWVHEALYEIGREFSFHTTSELTRKLAASLFQKNLNLSEIRDRSIEFSWRSFVGYQTPLQWKPNQSTTFDFIQNQYSTIILPQAGGEFTLSIENPEGNIVLPQAYCFNNKIYRTEYDTNKYQKYLENGVNIFEVLETKDKSIQLKFKMRNECRGLKIHVSGKGEQLPNVKYELKYNGQSLLNGFWSSSQPWYTVGTWVIYYSHQPSSNSFDGANFIAGGTGL